MLLPVATRSCVVTLLTVGTANMIDSGPEQRLCCIHSWAEQLSKCNGQVTICICWKQRPSPAQKMWIHQSCQSNQFYLLWWTGLSYLPIELWWLLSCGLKGVWLTVKIAHTSHMDHSWHATIVWNGKFRTRFREVLQFRSRRPDLAGLKKTFIKPNVWSD